jgi:hypothetical protein
MSFSGTKGYTTKPQPGVMLNPLHPLSKGLVGCWMFNEGAGSIAHDMTKHGLHGALTNMASNVQGSGWGGSKSGGGMHFDGTDDYITIADNALLDLPSAGSVVVSFNCRSQGGAESVLNKGAYTTSRFNQYFMDWKWGDVTHMEIVVGDGSTSQSVATGASLTVDTDYQVIGTWDGTNLTIYVNGKYSNSAAQTVTPYDDGGPMCFGSLDASSYRFDGIIDEIRIYNRALSAFDVEQLYYDPFCNLLRTPLRRYYVPAAGPTGAIMNQFQNFNIGADLYNGGLIA